MFKGWKLEGVLGGVHAKNAEEMKRTVVVKIGL